RASGFRARICVVHSMDPTARQHSHRQAIPGPNPRRRISQMARHSAPLPGQHTECAGFVAYSGTGCRPARFALWRERSWEHDDRRERDYSGGGQSQGHRDDAARSHHPRGIPSVQAQSRLRQARLDMSEKLKPADEASVPLGDMPAEEFRKYGHQVVDWIADYLASPDRYPVLSKVSPGQITAALPKAPPAGGEEFKKILADLDNIIVPGITHCNHPAFFAYFAVTGSGPALLGEMLSAAFNIN